MLNKKYNLASTLPKTQMDLFTLECASEKNWLTKDGTVNYYGKLFNQRKADIFFNSLSAKIEWQNDKLFIYGDSTSSADITIEPSISRVTMTNISAQKITGDIRQMLNAGTGIALSTNTNGITTIINTGGSPLSGPITTF